jgi:hypothetical protein
METGLMPIAALAVPASALHPEVAVPTFPTALDIHGRGPRPVGLLLEPCTPCSGHGGAATRDTAQVTFVPAMSIAKGLAPAMMFPIARKAILFASARIGTDGIPPASMPRG